MPKTQKKTFFLVFFQVFCCPPGGGGKKPGKKRKNLVFWSGRHSMGFLTPVGRFSQSISPNGGMGTHSIPFLMILLHFPALFVCEKDTEAVFQPYICLQQTHRLCSSLIYLCNKHTGCVPALYICVTDTHKHAGGRRRAAGGWRRAVVPTPPPLVSTPHPPKIAIPRCGGK